MNRLMMLIGTLFFLLGVFNLSISPSHLLILAYPLTVIGLFLIVLSFLVPPHYFESVRERQPDKLVNATCDKGEVVHDQPELACLDSAMRRQ